MIMDFPFFETKKAKQMKEAIEAMECAVAGKRVEVADAEERLKTVIHAAHEELKRLPVAGALVWRGRIR